MATPVEAIRIIEITSDYLDQTKQIGEDISKDASAKIIEIVSINKKSPKLITMKCSNEAEAKKLEEKLRENFKEKLIISSLKVTPPKLKLSVSNPTQMKYWLIN